MTGSSSVDCYLGEIRMVGCTQIPAGWAACDGSLIKITDNQALYALLGTRFGGDGVTTFALPNLCGRTAVGVGPGYAIGDAGGVTSVTLSEQQLPTHYHAFNAYSKLGGSTDERGAYYAGVGALAGNAGPPIYGPMTPVAVDPATVRPTGGGAAHTNMQPYIVLTCIIAVSGIFPSHN